MECAGLSFRLALFDVGRACLSGRAWLMLSEVGRKEHGIGRQEAISADKHPLAINNHPRTGADSGRTTV